MILAVCVLLLVMFTEVVAFEKSYSNQQNIFTEKSYFQLSLEHQIIHRIIFANSIKKSTFAAAYEIAISFI